MAIAAAVFWWIWLAMVLIGDPLFIHLGGEKASDTHFLVTHITYGLRVGILAWLAYHFLIAHTRS
jgi:hypothetical protein